MGIEADQRQGRKETRMRSPAAAKARKPSSRAGRLRLINSGSLNRDHYTPWACELPDGLNPWSTSTTFYSKHRTNLVRHQKLPCQGGHYGSHGFHRRPAIE